MVSTLGDVKVSDASLGDVYSDRLIHYQESLVRKIQEAKYDGDALISFSAGGRRFIVSSTEVSSIHKAEKITPVPAAKPWLLGVANLGGDLCTVTDFGMFLGLKRVDLRSFDASLIIPRCDERTALLVEKVYHLVDPNKISKVKDGDLNQNWSGDFYQEDSGEQVGVEIGLNALLSDESFLNANIYSDVTVAIK